MSFRCAFQFPVGVVLLILILGAVVGGCEPESGTGTVHPVEARIPHYHDADHTIEMDTSSVEGGPAQLASAWEAPTRTIGVQNGSGPALFGRVSDVIEDAQGRTLALDYENKEVRIFGANGTHLGSFGREGEGPGEFQYPNRLARFEDGTLMVTGRMGRVQFFEPAGETYEHTGGFTVEFTPEEACILDGAIYLHGVLSGQPQQTIHVYGASGTRQRSFGPVYDAENEFIRRSISQGTMACDRAMGAIVFAFSSAPLLYGYAPDGELQWTSRIRPFDPMPREQGVSEQGTTSLRQRAEPGTDIMQNLTDVPGPGVLAQRRRFPPKDSERADTPLHTYWISAGDGSGAYVGKTAAGGSGAGQFRHVTDRRMFSVRASPFPQVAVYKVDGVEWTAAMEAMK